MKYLIKNKCIIDEYTYDNVTLHKSIDCLKYLIENIDHILLNNTLNYQYNKIDILNNVWKNTTRIGNINCLKYLIEKKYKHVIVTY